MFAMPASCFGFVVIVSLSLSSKDLLLSHLTQEYHVILELFDKKLPVDAKQINGLMCFRSGWETLGLTHSLHRAGLLCMYISACRLGKIGARF